MLVFEDNFVWWEFDKLIHGENLCLFHAWSGF